MWQGRLYNWSGDYFRQDVVYGRDVGGGAHEEQSEEEASAEQQRGQAAQRWGEEKEGAQGGCWRCSQASHKGNENLIFTQKIG